MYMSIFHEYIALRATTYSSVFCLFYKYSKINYLCLDKGTEGKHNDTHFNMHWAQLQSPPGLYRRMHRRNKYQRISSPLLHRD